MTPSVTLWNPLCNVSECRAAISDYHSKNWAYDTKDFVVCQNCPHMTHTTIDWQWLRMWTIEDFHIPDSNEIPSNLLSNNGKTTVCTYACFVRTGCLGFTRGKHFNESDSKAQCWAVMNMAHTPIQNHPLWETYLFRPAIELK